MQMQEITETLSASKAPRKDGKGNKYVYLMSGNISLSDAAQTASRRIFKKEFC